MLINSARQFNSKIKVDSLTYIKKVWDSTEEVFLYNELYFKKKEWFVNFKLQNSTN